MAHREILRVTSEVDRKPAVELRRMLADRWSGLLTVRWEAVQPVVIGAGRFTTRERERLNTRRPRRHGGLMIQLAEPDPEVVAEVVRWRFRDPVLPGTSLKGAVRQVFELLTPSCSPVERDNKKINRRCTGGEICPACCFFGGLGLAGRAAFLDGRKRGAAQLSVRSVARPHSPRPPVPNTLRVYTSAASPGMDERTYTVTGVFESKIRLLNASEDELGLLFAALGVGRDLSLRVGGRKYTGWGGVRATVTEAVRRYPDAGQQDDAPAWAAALCDRALDGVPERRERWNLLHTALEDQ
jgi:hypothetical protein